MGLGVWRYAKDLKQGYRYRTSSGAIVQALGVEIGIGVVLVCVLLLKTHEDTPQGARTYIRYKPQDMVYCDN